jgi:hypothetical protein
MKNTHLFLLGLTVLLWGTATTFGQNNCTPCEPLCGPGGKFASPFTFGGALEAGIYTNNHGFNNNGPMHVDSNRRTDFMLNQLHLYGEKEMNTQRGFDWGTRADFVYGTDALSMQCWGDETFDFDWGTNKHGYGCSVYQLYTTLGYKDLSVKIGKFITPVGWEGALSQDNFFYSHSFCYWIEPATHTGVVGTYNLTNRLTINAGWTSGMDSSFQNPHGNSAVLTGLSYSLTDKATIYYWLSQGKQFDPASLGRNDYSVQSFVLEWMPTDRFTYICQYNLRNDNIDGNGRYSAYGINNHFLYKLNDRWGVGTRFEWLRDNGSAGFAGEPADYYGLTLGLNWNPRKNVSIRPEVRYDWCRGATPFGQSNEIGGVPTRPGTQSDQVSGGCALVVSF